MNTKSPSEIIDEFGGTSKVAELFGVTTGAVSQWRTDGIPQARLMYLKLLRPDVFDEKKSGTNPENKKKAA